MPTPDERKWPTAEEFCALVDAMIHREIAGKDPTLALLVSAESADVKRHRARDAADQMGFCFAQMDGGPTQHDFVFDDDQGDYVCEFCNLPAPQAWRDSRGIKMRIAGWLL